MGNQVSLTEQQAGQLINLLRVGVYPNVNAATIVSIHDGLLEAIRAAGIGVFPVAVPDEEHDAVVRNAVADE